MCFISYFILINEQLKCSRTLKASYNDICQYTFQLDPIRFNCRQSIKIIFHASPFYILNVVY